MLIIVTTVLAFLASLIPNPLLALIISEGPYTSIEGPLSGIVHPEGVCFSPSGDFIAVANAKGSSITFYPRISNSEVTFETEPAFTIAGLRSKLSYPHDLSFTPDGSYLAVACARGKLVAIFKKSEEHSYYETVPCAIIGKKEKFLKQAQAVKYSPVENILAVANVLENSIALYRFQGESYDSEPYQIIVSTPDLLCNPDGLAFSSDGELLAVTSHIKNAVLIFQRIPNSEGLYTPKPVEILKGSETNLCFPHSLCFHPSKDYLIVSSAGGKKTLSVFKKISEDFPRYGTFPIQTLEIYNPDTIDLQKLHPEEGGVKGVAFSNDGTQIGLCSSDMGSEDKKILIYSFSG